MCVLRLFNFCVLFSNFLLFLSGACKVLNVNSSRNNAILVSEFHWPPPKGFLLKTTIEIMLRENLHNFEKRRNEETSRPVLVNNKWIPITILIDFTTLDFLGAKIELGNYRTFCFLLLRCDFQNGSTLSQFFSMTFF